MIAAFFDLDGTLLPPPSAERRLLGRLYREEGNRVRAASCLLRSLARRARGVHGFDRRYFSAAEFKLHIVATAREVILALPRPAVESIEAHRAGGHLLVLISGAPDALVREIGARLGFCVAIGDPRDANSPPSAETLRLGSKLQIARDIAVRHQIALDDCWAYGNEFADRLLLDAVAHPVAINPSKKLSRLAAANRWLIETWFSSSRHRAGRVSSATISSCPTALPAIGENHD